MAQYTSDDRTNEITNKRRGQVTQAIVNAVAARKRINNTDKGELTSTTTAVYEKVQ